MNRFFAVAWKELIQLRRDRMTLGMMVGIPILQLLLFGYAINTDVRHMATLVYDQDHSDESRAFVARMVATTYYDVVGYVESYDDLSRLIRAGRAKVGLVVARNFRRELAAGRQGRLQLIIDGSDPQTVASATSTAVSLAQLVGARFTAARLGLATQPSPIALEPTTWYNPDLRTAVFVVPGLVGVILTWTTVLLTAMAIARERERGTLEQLIVSPIGRTELIVAKIVPYIIIGYVQMTLVLAVGRWVFGVPVIGSLALLYALAAFFIAANLSIGLFFSTLARTQQQAMQMSFFFVLPNILLSGFMFPWEGMPRPAQWIAQILPLTHFLRILRGIILKGSRFPEIANELCWLAALLAALIAVASLRFRKRLA